MEAHNLLLELFLCATLCLLLSQGAELNIPVFLEKFGYLDDSPDHAHDEASVSQAIIDYQEFNGLRQTGQLDKRTIRFMKKPRCGLPDVIKPHVRPHGMNIGTENHPPPQAFSAPGYKWENHEVTYKVLGYTRKLGGQQQIDAYADAFKKWSDVSDLTFLQKTRGDADILINYGRGEHGDGPGNAFDGKGRTLAHAYFPGPTPISGDTHFDDDEQWTLGVDSGTNLEIVAAHEFGHALGLGHSRDKGALMFPIYRGYDENYGLGNDDIRGIQSLYGPNRKSPTPRPTRPPRRTTTTTTTAAPRTGQYCGLKFDAIEQVHDGKIYVFRKDRLYTIAPNGATNKIRTRRVFPGAPTNVGTVVYDRYRRKLYMFKGTRYWRYTGYSLDEGYPKTLPADFQKPTAGWQWVDGAIYLFRGNDYFRWAENLTRYSSGYPRTAQDYWRGFPKIVGATLRSYDGYYYAFKGRKVWKFNSRAALSSGRYPQDIRPTWLNCDRPADITAGSPALSFLASEINETPTTD